MDLSFDCGDGRFNYRVCAVITHGEKLLAMQDGRLPYYYLPGGRVHLHETAQDALLRELKEELGVEARPGRPLWLNQAFFTEDATGEKYHEVCIYFLVDITGTGLKAKGERFTLAEGPERKNTFEWLPFGTLAGQYLYPEFIKTRIFKLPQRLELITEVR